MSLKYEKTKERKREDDRLFEKRTVMELKVIQKSMSLRCEPSSEPLHSSRHAPASQGYLAHKKPPPPLGPS